MKATLLLLLGGIALLAAGTAAADPILDVIYENVSHVEGCANATASGDVGVGVESGIPPKITLGVPELTPPSPDCLTLPA